MNTSKKNRRGGRPPKFEGKSRPVTVTLPESTLAQLASVSEDRARAIVKVTDAAMGREASARSVDVVEISPGLGIIVVPPSRALRSIKWLRLIEIAPARFLLLVPSGTHADTLELAVSDLLEQYTDDADRERKILIELHRCITNARRSDAMSKAELLLVSTRKTARQVER